MRKFRRLQLSVVLLLFSLFTYAQNHVVVSNCNANGWQRGGEPYVTVVNGPGIPPYPIGSAEFKPGPGFGGGYAQYATSLYAGIEMRNITELLYYTYVQNSGGDVGNAVYIILNVDVNADGVFDPSTGDDMLFFDPDYQAPNYYPSFPQGPVTPGIWQRWNTMVGGWWSLNGTADARPGTGVKDYLTIIRAYPGIPILAQGNSLRLVVGLGPGGAWDNFHGNADGVQIRIGTSNNTIYNFELCQANTDSDGDGDPDGTDCAPLDPNIHHNATEVCNGIDDNCNGLIDDNAAQVYYPDVDNDGYGNPALSFSSCQLPPPGYVTNNGDCNDNNPNIHPGAVEICNGIDDNCNGQIDENAGQLYYPDVDNDGYGNPAYSFRSCQPPAAPHVTNNGDCNDNNANIHPGAVEMCNDGIDNNCDGFIDNVNKPIVDAGPDKTVYHTGSNTYPGYPNCATLTANVSLAPGPYQYSWSNGATTPSITVCPTVTTTYTVTVTDANNCKNQDQVTVFVINVVCGNKNDKVIVCHNGHAICISPNAVQTHLNHGDVLGNCPPAPVTNRMNSETEADAVKPLNYRLSNFPNPFGGITSIRYSIPSAGKVSLKVNDIMGREMAVLVNAEKLPGNYVVDFDAGNLKAGVYYCRLSAIVKGREYSVIQKLVITR